MKTLALSISALVAFGVAHASPHCQDMADKVAKEFAAEKRMSNADKPAKCSAISKVISDLSDLAAACGADQQFIHDTYMPLAKFVGDEAPSACHG